MRRRTRFNETSSGLVDYLVTKHGLSQNDIAATLGVDKSFVSRVRASERELSTAQVRRLADHVGVPMGAMLIDAMPTSKTLSPERKQIAELCEQLMRKVDVAFAEIRAKRNAYSGAR